MSDSRALQTRKMQCLDQHNVDACGYWIFKFRFLRRFATPTTYIVIYGLTGCLISTGYAYFNGTISTLEKRFKMPSSSSGLISIGNDVSQMISALTLTYLLGSRHRPRWMGLGLLAVVMFCLLTATSHFVFGAGSEALALTREYGASENNTIKLNLMDLENSKALCQLSGPSGNHCSETEMSSHFNPQLLLFAAHFLAGIGSSIYYTLGYSYLDDNADAKDTASMFSLAYFLNMLGPALGYNLASICLGLYIAPALEPVIDQTDPRWLGAWWLGWLVLSVALACLGWLLSLFPKRLPNVAKSDLQREGSQLDGLAEAEQLVATHSEAMADAANFKKLLGTLRRLATNKIFMCNNLSSVFYFFGFTPYFMFTPKYLEIQFRQTAAAASFITGNAVLLFTGLGVLISGVVISKYQPPARSMVAWNALVGFVTMAGMFSYAFIGCSSNEQALMAPVANSSCSLACHCDYIAYTPICGADNLTYVSPCHAGCRRILTGTSGDKIYSSCACLTHDRGHAIEDFEGSAVATLGACPVDCSQALLLFLVIMCVSKLIGSTGRASNFLVSVRSVLPGDKTVAMGFGMFLMSVFTFIPSPIFFGWLFDRFCLVWGKTCSTKGNCWQYDARGLRYALNTAASAFVAVGVLFDCIVWLLAKNLKIFAEENDETDSPSNDQL